jgi:lipoprotein-anchoring transpeptidase ErfK/SrfK
MVFIAALYYNKKCECRQNFTIFRINNWKGKRFMEKLKSMSKKKKILVGTLTGLLLVAAIVYFSGAYYYSNHFLKGTTINGINCSNKTAEQIETAIKENISSYELTIVERKDLKDTVKGTDIDLTYLNDGAITKYQQSQNPFVWPASYIAGKTYTKKIDTVSYDEAKLEAIFKKFECFKKKNIEKPVCAYPEYAGNNQYTIVEEVEGNKMVSDKLMEAIETSIAAGEEKLDADKAGCYEEPQYRKDSPEILQLKEDMEALVKGSITWDFSNRYIKLVKYKDLLKDNKVVINGDITSQFIKIKNHTTAKIDSDAIEEWLISFATDSNTIYNGRKFVKHNGKKINVPSGGPYGWRMNWEKEKKAIKKMMKKGTSKERTPYYTQTAMEGTNGQINDIGDNYVEVDLTNQSVYVYKNGSQVFSTDCVSGNTSKGMGTHTGVGVVQYKARNKVLGGAGYDYATPVSYWMPFNGGEGLHDADWRSTFGGTIYKNNGSHGCVNLPPSAAATIYGIIDAGWPVVVYY